ncbi:hypothetical protein WOLCODRAFT_17323 [Wolfiporia cocos MD-104 SS10]|uniref:Uncharacterized protein n=1 Tax=Wolfiporia cocos (strain MD-104) TaxID=742152 RepID=A0A2H3JHW4_WOLCO|nr:hypothetical protein WOLCODRAFT_17323 [Wolfiporia cocos MD-104 SS10]
MDRAIIPRGKEYEEGTLYNAAMSGLAKEARTALLTLRNSIPDRNSDVAPEILNTMVSRLPLNLPSITHTLQMSTTTFVRAEQRARYSHSKTTSTAVIHPRCRKPGALRGEEIADEVSNEWGKISEDQPLPVCTEQSGQERRRLLPEILR